MIPLFGALRVLMSVVIIINNNIMIKKYFYFTLKQLKGM